MPSKIVPIKYTSRNYDSIRRDLINHAKRYYPESFKDFNEGSFGSIMLDTVSYVGDILSFYLDYQANEAFLDTASEPNNVLKIAKQLGYKFQNTRSSTTMASFFIAVPANQTSLGPNKEYLPVLKKGSMFSTKSGTNFILTEDVRFDNPSNEIRPAKIGQNGVPLTYAIKSHGVVVSGMMKTDTISLGDYSKFLRIRLSDTNIVEIISVYDDEGNQYYEVDYLTQNIIYNSYTNKDTSTAVLAKEILKPIMVPRRFMVETENNGIYLQFGDGTDDLIPDNKNMLADPGKTVLETFGKQYISSDSFDPINMLNNNKLGISPSNTTLYITYRYNDANAVLNFASDTLTDIRKSDLFFTDVQKLLPATVSEVIGSLEVTNETPIIGDFSNIDSSELKVRIKNSFSAQSRAVTLEDYKAMCYNMPAKYGSVKRVNVVRDEDSIKRNINLYVLCEGSDGYLTPGNGIVKANLKTWISKNKMINDTIDILDGKILNYGIEFTAIASSERSKYDVLTDAINRLKADFMTLTDFGQTFFKSDILNSLKKVDGLLDVTSLKIVGKNGGVYADTTINIDKITSADGNYINIPKNVIMELKYPNSDIKGTII